MSAAVLTLLADAAGDGGLVCLVDDVHWLDRSTVDALMFTVRRLDAEGIAMILSARPAAGESDDDRSAERRDSPGMSVLRVGPLDAEAAAELIGRRTGVAVARSVAVTLSAAAEGNPLALAELAGLLTADHLRGRMALPDPLPIGEGMERAFRAQIRAQPRTPGRPCCSPRRRAPRSPRSMAWRRPRRRDCSGCGTAG